MLKWISEKNWRLFAVASLVFIFTMFMRIKHYDYNITSLLNIGKQWGYFEQFEPTLDSNMVVLTESQGFDTFTFYYLVGRDPFLQRDEWKSDKTQRIVYPLACYLLAFGQSTLLPYTMILMQFIAAFWLFYELMLLLKALNMNKMWVLWVLLSSGMILSVLYLLTEPLSFALALWAYRKDKEGKIGWAALALVLALLTREAMAVIWFAFLVHKFFLKEWKTMGIYATALIPLVVLNIFLAPYMDSKTAPLLLSSGSFGWPMVGFVQQIQKTYVEEGPGFWKHGVLIIPMCAMVLLSFGLCWKAWWKEKDLAALLVLGATSQQILFQRPMWEGFFNVSRLTLGIVVFFLLIPADYRKHWSFKAVVGMSIIFSCMAIARCLCLAPEIKAYILTP